MGVWGGCGGGAFGAGGAGGEGAWGVGGGREVGGQGGGKGGGGAREVSLVRGVVVKGGGGQGGWGVKGGWSWGGIWRAQSILLSVISYILYDKIIHSLNQSRPMLLFFLLLPHIFKHQRPMKQTSTLMQNNWEIDRLFGKQNKHLGRIIVNGEAIWRTKQAPWQNNWEVERLFGKPNKHLGRTIGKLIGYLGNQTSTLAEQLGSSVAIYASKQAPWQNNWEVERLFWLINNHLGITIGKLKVYLGNQTSTLAEQLGS